MQHASVLAAEPSAAIAPSTWRRDALIALALAVILTIAWSITDWQRVGHLILPDPDDMMRLAQVRDWLAGQATNDWTQYRMAPPLGSPMHWSRINDVGIAALILVARPFAGTHGAELFAVLVYPALLFAIAMFLSARIARGLWGAAAGPVAALLTALAYPGTTVFIPGRIDHHALQVVLIQLFVLALMRPPTLWAGAGAGLAAALSLIVGLETAPQVAVLVLVLALLWIVDGAGERPRLVGFAAALGITTLVFLIFLRPTVWSAAMCDAFTPASSTAMLAGAGGLGILAVCGPLLTDWRSRLAIGAVLGGVVLGGTLYAFPACIAGPYGAMSPFLREAFLPYIDEANGLLRQRPAKIVSYGGMLAAASLVSIWMLSSERLRWRTLAPDAVVVLTSATLIFSQVRGVYIGAPLAAPMLATLVLRARQRLRHRTLTVIAAWLVSAGMAYVTVADRIESLFAPVTHATSEIDAPKVQVLCSGGDAWAQVNRAPPGVIMAGTSIAAYLLGATHHATIGAGYHRNDRGNMAMYRFFLGKPEQARSIARSWRVDYVLFCPGDFDEIQVARTFPRSLAASLRAGRRPVWLEPLPLHDTPMRFYRVR